MMSVLEAVKTDQKFLKDYLEHFVTISVSQ
jgi:hypothetical protein